MSGVDVGVGVGARVLSAHGTPLSRAVVGVGVGAMAGVTAVAFVAPGALSWSDDAGTPATAGGRALYLLGVTLLMAALVALQAWSRVRVELREDGLRLSRRRVVAFVPRSSVASARWVNRDVDDVQNTVELRFTEPTAFGERLEFVPVDLDAGDALLAWAGEAASVPARAPSRRPRT